MILRLRDLATEERTVLERLAHARSALAGKVKRTQVVLRRLEGTRTSLEKCTKSS